MNKDELLDALADERDRLADQADGLELALEAGCSPVVLVALLVPVAGTIIATAARAACAVLTAGDIERRIERIRQLVRDVESLSDVVVAAPEAKLPELELRVRTLIEGLRRVDAASELADAAIDGTRGLVDDVRSVAGTVGNVLGFVFSPYGLLAAAGGWYLWSRRGKG